MPLIEQPLDPEDAERARAAREYRESAHGRGADAPGLFDPDADPDRPLPDWLQRAVDAE